MAIANPYYDHASRLAEACNELLKKLKLILNRRSLSLSAATIAINLWSAYIPRGRKTFLIYPRGKDGKSLLDVLHTNETAIKSAHKRYLKVLGRNASINHLIIENPCISEIAVNAAASALRGPWVDESNSEMCMLEFPFLSDSGEKVTFIHSLIPPDILLSWRDFFLSNEFEHAHEKRIRDELSRWRSKVMEDEPPDEFKAYLVSELTAKKFKTSRPENLFDAWLKTLQLTALASVIWGPRWVTKQIVLPEGIADFATASLSVTTHVEGSAEDPITENLHKEATGCSEWIQNELEKITNLNIPDKKLTHGIWKGEMKVLADEFSKELGDKLRGEFYEEHALHFTAMVTEGLDALPLSPADLTVAYEFDEKKVPKVRMIESDESALQVVRAEMLANAYFLNHQDVGLQFEWEWEGGKALLVPRSLVFLKESPLELFRKLGESQPGCVRIFFDSDEAKVLHFKREQSQDNPTIFISSEDQCFESWNEASNKPTPNWSILAEVIYDLLKHLRYDLGAETYFKKWSSTLDTLTDGQMKNLSAGIAEVRREKRGCLIFVTQLAANDDSGLLLPGGKGKTPAKITELGTVWNIIARIPEDFSANYLRNFSDLAGMDGETIVYARIDKKQRNKERGGGYIKGRSFIQLPSGIPPLTDRKSPEMPLNWKYLGKWNRLQEKLGVSFSKLIEAEPWITSKTLCNPEAGPASLLSFGTRHRKAAMVTMFSDKTVAITCSASGPIRVWLGGIPIVTLKVHEKSLIPEPPLPKNRDHSNVVPD